MVLSCPWGWGGDPENTALLLMALSLPTVGTSVLVTVAKQSAKGLKRKTNQEERSKTTRSDCVVAWGQFLMNLNINARIMEMSQEGLG